MAAYDEDQALEPSETGRGDAIAALAGSAVSAAAGLHLGGDTGAILSATGGQAVAWLYDRLQMGRRCKVERVFHLAQAEAGLTTEQLLARLLMDDLHGELASRVLIAAQDAGTEAHLRALSRTLASGQRLMMLSPSTAAFCLLGHSPIWTVHTLQFLTPSPRRGENWACQLRTPFRLTG